MDPDNLITKLRLVIYALRRGQTNQVLAIVTLGGMAAGEYLHHDHQELVWGVLLAYGVGLISLVWLTLRLWKVAMPPPVSNEKPVPTAIKGLLPWVVGDGGLFARLGRRSELQALLGLVQDEQTSVTVLRGESGAGKTSLLQAGLRYTLGVENCIYWEALPQNASESLLHSIKARYPEIVSLDSLSPSSPNRWVLILDQFEQLHANLDEHIPIFQLLNRLAKEPPPHRCSVVVSFRRDYAADWLDFERESGFRAEQLPVNLLSRRVAQEVMATIASQAGFTLEQALIDRFLTGVSQPRGISPLDLSIGLESLANFARQRGIEEVTLQDYKLVGEAEGLFLSFVQEKFEEVPESIRPSIIKGMVLSLVDLSTNVRVAAGDTAAVIASKAGLTESQVRPWLDRLALPRVRLLEKLEADHYRLPHERLVAALRRISGTELAAHEQKLLTFEKGYQDWKLMRSGKYLFTGTELSEMLLSRTQFVSGEDAPIRVEYLDACLTRRRLLQLLGIGAVATAVAAAYGVYVTEDAILQRRALANWRLPSNLFTEQHKLNGLDIQEAVTSVDWIRSKRLSELACILEGDGFRPIMSKMVEQGNGGSTGGAQIKAVKLS